METIAEIMFCKSNLKERESVRERDMQLNNLLYKSTESKAEMLGGMGNGRNTLVKLSFSVVILY